MTSIVEQMRKKAAFIRTRYDCVVDVKIQYGCYPEDANEEWTRLIVIVDTEMHGASDEIMQMLNNFSEIYIRSMHEDDGYNEKRMEQIRLTKIFIVPYRNASSSKENPSIHVFRDYKSIEKKFSFNVNINERNGLPYLNKNMIVEYLADAKILDNMGMAKDAPIFLCVLGTYGKEILEVYYVAPFEVSKENRQKNQNSMLSAIRKYYEQKTGINASDLTKGELFYRLGNIGYHPFHYVQKIDD